ncbi:MAG: haloalkane dehalogenase [Kofleriaceae bacterium]
MRTRSSSLAPHLIRAALALGLAAGLPACATDGDELPDESTLTSQVDELIGTPCGGVTCARSRVVRVRDTYMHYREAGNRNGPPILLLHGQPTWSYLYRNIIPRLPPDAHIIAPDAVGYGLSGKPDIGYSWQEHIDYMTSFIEALRLRDVTLVVHDFGSFEGLAYAANHPDNVRGIVMMESIAAPLPPLDVFGGMFPPGSPTADFAQFLITVKTDPAAAERLIVDENIFVEKLLQDFIVRPLTRNELNAYRLPFRTRESRVKMIAIPLGAPAGGVPADNHAIVSAYAGYLATSSVPKLILYGDTGLIMPPPVANQLAQAFPNTRTESIGQGIHFLQEDHPVEIADAITRFYRGL